MWKRNLIVYCEKIATTVGLEQNNLEDDEMQNDSPHSSVVKTSHYRKHTQIKTKTSIFKGGCIDHPTSPVNGNIQCSLDSGCRASCKADYKFPNGEKQLVVLCHDGKWHVTGTDWDFVPHCEPICLPQCQNNGICIAPHQCNCGENYSGPQCQYETKPCLNTPPPVLNSRRQCNSKSCTVSCARGFVYPDGSSVANLECRNGNWIAMRNDWVTIPDCQAVCSPPCKNGGICLPLNTCQCPQDYRGSQCQYSKDRCSPEILNFNGAYKCKGDAHAYSCVLDCSQPGIEFTFPPATEYICTYDNGYFEPQPIPQCKVTSSNYQIIPAGSSKNSYLKITNHSWTFEDTLFSQTSHVERQKFIKESHGIKTLYDVNQLSSDKSSNNIQNVVDIVKSNYTIVEDVHRPEAKTCFTWGGVHYKTFDGDIYTFDSDCTMTLIQETQDSAFTITIQNSNGCKNHNDTICYRILNIYIQGKEYILKLNDNNIPILQTNKKKILPIPAQLTGLRVEMSGNLIVASLDTVGINLKWDGGLFVQIKSSESLWNRTAGLCGRMNGDPADDKTRKDNSHSINLATFIADWKIDKTCDDNLASNHKFKSDITEESIKFCDNLFADLRFKGCSKTLDLAALQSTCQLDYCNCHEVDKRKCACETMNVYVRQCYHDGLTKTLSWRHQNLCPMNCTGGRIYNSCGSKYQQSCGEDLTQAKKIIDVEDCEEGCFCPEGTIFHENKCIAPGECPCRLRGKSFPPGTIIPKNCNTCTCVAGQWICTQVICSSRCSVVGDPHYVTFDGKRYDFMGKCSYYLVKGDNYSIEAENVACLGAISESMGLIPSDSPSCVKSIKICQKNITIKLKQNHQVEINNEEITKFPIINSNTKIRIASSIFIVVHMPNNLEIWWDGISRVYINAPSIFYGNTKGLCGTFTNNQKDDFLTPSNDIEQSILPFTNKWKTNEQCEDILKEDTTHPCDKNPERLSNAEKYCSIIWSNVFSSCHWHVDPEEFYKNCKYDMCSCEGNIEKCLCPILSSYAKECAEVGVKIIWRTEVSECQLHCPAGQEYQICGNSCTRSCNDISFNHVNNIHKICNRECVEGCNCPEGQTLDSHGECIDIDLCPCYNEGMEFKPGYREIRAGIKRRNICTCKNAIWSCQEATDDEIKKYPSSDSLKTICSTMKNLELTNCEPAIPRTCRNMNDKVIHSPAICMPGCICKKGYVLDSPSGNCVKQESCPCYHGGKSYTDGSTMQEECNTCKCDKGHWKCTDKICPGICSVWGDSHYKTFDDKTYDFQGACDYVLVKGSFGADDCFEISTQNVPCGTSWVTCSKAITLSIGTANNREKITLTNDKQLSLNNYQRIAVRYAGEFLFLDVPDLGLVVQWDKGTRVYIKLDPKWKSKTKGLCGDYNDNSQDDFKTPSGGISEVSARIFGDSWKKNNNCPEPKDITDTCVQHPERKIWAVEKCGKLKTSLFEACHSEVDIEPYIERCIFDTCGCDQGGDCECLCTALAAYAHECNNRGVPIKWRSKNLCPMQCDEKCSNYSPCISTCPRETCDYLLNPKIKKNSQLCTEDTCIEGCLPKECPNDEVYLNSTYQECVPRSTCKPICLEKEGVIYYEGDKVSSDLCQTCFCSHGKIICNGLPCTSTTTTTTTTTRPAVVYMEESEKCIDGWTPWINKHSIKKSNNETKSITGAMDTEPLPSMIDLLEFNNSSRCTKDKMIDIKCRSIDGHLSPKETGLDVECSLERGLICQSNGNELPCVDFEISVLCKCENTTASDNCDITRPSQADPIDCHVFYECAPGTNGATKLIKKTCGKDMFYNPVAMICDWWYNVITLRPLCRPTLSPAVTTVTSTTTTEAPSTNKCKEDEIWNDCAIKCSRTCQYYNYQLKKQNICIDGTRDCVPGCTAKDKKTCGKNKYWRDPETCVDIADCNCISHNEESVKPGVVVEETNCKRCQCLSNFYTCDNTSCEKSTTVETTTPTVIDTTTPVISLTTNIIIVPSTLSPAAPCISKHYNSLVEYFKGTSEVIEYNSSSSEDDQPWNHDPKFWQAKYTNTNQWYEIKLPKLEPIYGIIISGNPIDNKFVTSYKLLYSQDGHEFSYMPDILSGPIDAFTPVKHIFTSPIEAKIIKINPQTWHNGISMSVDLIGCDDELQTVTPKIIIDKEEETIKPICDEPMGFDNGVMIDEQVTVSSTTDSSSLSNIKLSSPGIWQPKLDNPHQYVQFNFFESRNITGIETKGANNIWTIAYKIYYGNDGVNWNPIIDHLNIEKIFTANFDDKTTKINYFTKPIQAQYLKIQPIKWHRHVGLKVEVHGCFISYPTVTNKPVKIQVIQSACNVCDEIFLGYDNVCKCNESLWWNGVACVEKHNCPCVYEGVPYVVGATFESSDCRKCICTMTGTVDCQLKPCEPCDEPNMRSVVTELCGCACKPCSTGTRLCPTSNICINDNLWCNGVKDCPDDETNCREIIENPSVITNNHSTIIEVTTVEIKNVTTLQCERPVCPPGYKLVPVNQNSKRSSKSSVKNSGGGVKGGTKGRSRGRPKETRKISHESTIFNDDNNLLNDASNLQINCQQFSCVPTKPPPIRQDNKKPIECPKVECPQNYKIIYESQSMFKLEACPKYVCKPPPPIEVICNITGRTFNTFDNLEYKYDICNHILARNMLNNEWYVNLEKHCDNLNQNCKQLLVITIDDDVVIFHADMHVEINEFSFSPRQVKRLGDKSGSFRISRIGNIIHFVCSKYGFWIIWDENTNVKIGITTNLKNYVDGLCGFFDGNPDNDRQMPDGKQAKTSQDFGNSWIMDGSAECQAPKILCSREVYDHAKEICNEMMDRSFSICRNHLNFDKYLSRCLETSCMCINGNQTINECRCRALTSFTTDCQASDINIDLSTWRNIHNCPVNCPAPFVHKDCFRNKCEMSCDNLQEIEPCPLMEGVCFCGCFCPDGTIRNGENCIPASECRDCTCQGFGNGNFINFDKNNFTFTGNCTYVLSQDVSTINDNKNTYQILITNVPCERGICTEAISLSYKDHYLEIQQNINDKKNKKISVTMDGESIDKFPLNNNWINIIEENEKNLKILIPVIQLELTSFVHNFGFTLKLPSHIFGGAMEGLCGNCNANDQDDIKKKNGELTDNIQDFGMSWLVSGLPQARILSDGDCGVQNTKEICLPPLNDPCKKLLDGKLFGQCHSIIDPSAYLSSCYDTLCKKGDICGDIEAYARSCRQTGLCSNWRSIDFCPYNCPADLEYQSCGSNCPKTCDTINDQSINKCAEEFNQEGCFCPKNYVTHNGTCVLEKNCFICDSDGHIDGDTWQPDKCTTCTCNKKIINCQVTNCPTIATICDINSSPVLVEPSKSNEECCPKYICIPKPTIPTTTTVCLDTQQPDCGWGQMMKTTIGNDGCQKFICECLPPEECPTVNLEATNIPGIVEIVNSSSCCPKAERICKVEMCPSAPSCPEYYTLETSQSPEGCCINYKCQLPKDICLYSMTTDNSTIVGKKIGEKWQDGPCLSCICEIDYNNETKSNCLSTKCPGIEDNQHKNDYVLIEKQITGECCPLIEAIACKDDNGIVHNIGNEWYPDKKNSCLINKCEIEPDGIVKKKTITQQCSINCERGYEYKQPEEPSKKCCGDCIPVSCVVNDTIKNIGETWKSADYCTDYRCLIENGTLRVIESTTTCEKLDQFELDNYEIHTELLNNECCPKYKRTGCKSNGKIYNSGATWKDEFDNCLTNMCVDVKDTNKIELTHVRQDCNVTCEFGWEYESSNNSQECCGRCKQVYCFDKGILHKPETTWSTPDNCTSYECKYSENKEQLIIQTMLTICPDVSTCPVEFIYQDGCCQKCNMTNIFDLRQTCAAEVLEIQSTIGILKEKNQHGVCKNIEGIDGMTECRGNCQSSTHFDPVSWIQETDCNCCQPIDMKNINVDLVCDDGVKFTKKIYVPTACSCETCSGSLRKNIMPIKGHRKIGAKG
ncbi:hemocytin [Aphidius gifuensis]|uniref:hemocytin n=1 Tax=Aphidius gifuensis TaxID=684658 RepID=UPI001CDC2631|nr:hemocytin [Aphidius gifuensis]